MVELAAAFPPASSMEVGRTPELAVVEVVWLARPLQLVPLRELAAEPSVEGQELFGLCFRVLAIRAPRSSVLWLGHLGLSYKSDPERRLGRRGTPGLGYTLLLQVRQGCPEVRSTLLRPFL